MLRSLAALVVGTLLASTFVSPARANEDDGAGPDENVDLAEPGPVPNDSRPAVTPPTSQLPTTTLSATTARVRPNAIDDFRYDELVLEGRAADVCAGRLLTGSSWAFYEITDRFGGTPGTMYYCRERWDAANDPDCNGTLVNPATNPNFTSTCWSNHARGRAIDVMVGRLGSGYNRTRGLNIVNWLLATDAYGNVNANARKLGIQQILFADRCWNADGDRGIANWSAMRPCGIGHHDHVHMDLTIRGANGQTSYWGEAPVVDSKFDTQVWWIWRAPYRQAISWWNLRATNEGAVVLPAQYDRGYRGDFDGDGLTDESMLWDDETGNWVVQNWNDGDSLNAIIGNWSPGFDEVVVGDFDADGRLDETLTWDKDTGQFGVQQWYAGYQRIGRHVGRIPVIFDEMIVADLDGNGFQNDTFLRDRDTGYWVVWSWTNWIPTFRASGNLAPRWDLVVAGDWSAGGDVDELFVMDRSTREYFVQSWNDYRPTSSIVRMLDRVIYDFGVPGDYDTDGRMDDLMMYDTASGIWTIFSFHRNIATRRISQDWASYDQIVSGEFLN